MRTCLLIFGILILSSIVAGCISEEISEEEPDVNVTVGVSKLLKEMLKKLSEQDELSINVTHSEESDIEITPHPEITHTPYPEVTYYIPYFEKPSVEVTYYSPYPLAFYKVFYNQNQPDITVKVTNNGLETMTVKVTSEYQGYSEPAYTTVEVAPGETVTINQTIPLLDWMVEQIDTKTKFSLHYRVEYSYGDGWSVADEQTVMVDVYPMDTMVWGMWDSEGGWIPLHDYIAVFVTPKSYAVRELLSIAKEYVRDEYDGRYSLYGLYRELPGYQCEYCLSENDWRMHTALQVKAIYNALKYYYGVSYVSSTVSFGSGLDIVERVSLPDDSLYFSSANCIDGAVLFASALEAIGIHPYIVIVPGHAFVAWDIDGERGGMIDALETTMIAKYDFEDALRRGEEEINEYWYELTDSDEWNGVLVDIKECREAGILPLR
ncbi:hypothetical protein [Archaeoglobus sp.]